jgi:hypothetical protein
MVVCKKNKAGRIENISCKKYWSSCQSIIEWEAYLYCMG